MHCNTAIHDFDPQPGQAILPGLVNHHNRVVTLIGGGGKTSLMYLWAGCLQAAGCSAITSTTTKLSATEREGVDLICTDTLDKARLLLSPANNSKCIRTIHGGVSPDTGKVTGLPSEWIDALSKEFPQTIFLVEGDGSAERSLKGHLPHEPVIPDSTTLLVPVIGLDAIGKPVSEAFVHRADVFCRIAGAIPDQIITPAAVANVLFNHSGYLSKARRRTTILPFLNKAETSGGWKTGCELAQKLLVANYPGLDRVLIGSVNHNRFLVLS